MTGQLDVERHGERLLLVLNNPDKRNSLDVPVLEALEQAADIVANDAEIKTVVLRGAGRHAFCAGADFDAFAAQATIEEGVALLDGALKRAIDALQRIPVPVIAAIEGACFGGGVQVALAADIRIASTTCRFGIPAAKIGLAYPIVALRQITTLAGSGGASLMLLGGEPFGAIEALQRRIVDQVIDAERFETRIDELCAAICACERPVLEAYVAIIRNLANNQDARAVAAHADLARAGYYKQKLQDIAASRRARPSRQFRFEREE